ncbi:MAG: class I SAM-dependent methyltransferase, partial [Chloroflexi bacterium]|nr:class I SAM-dependent methyltransferase [Chloroflexota bacterium]
RTAYTYLPQSVDYFLQADRLSDLYRRVGLADVGYIHLALGTVAIHYGVKPA